MHVLVIVLVMLVVTLVAAHLRRGGVPEPAERRQWVVDDFARRKARQWLLVIPIGAVFVALQWAKRHPDDSWMTLMVPAAVAVALVSAWFSYRNWRCRPAAPTLANTHGRRGAAPNAIPRCASPLSGPTGA